VKQCGVCEQIKPLNEFYKRTSSPDGYRNDCKKCRKKKSLENYYRNFETISEKRKVQYAEFIKNNPTYHKDIYWADPEKKRKENVQNYAAHRKKRIAAAVKWAKENRHKASANKAAYKAAKKKATPTWLTEDDFWMMQQAYELAGVRSDTMGFVWHVDHIVPLRGKNFSGLHVPWNLQVIPGSLNCSKQNRLEG